MKKKNLLYLPLAILAIFAFSALAVHYSQIFDIQEFASREADLPFSYMSEVLSVSPETKRAGIQTGDRIQTINGAAVNDTASYRDAINKLQNDQPILLTMQRRTADGQIQTFETSVMPAEIKHDSGYYAQFVVGFLFTYILPTFCILLGFWCLGASARPAGVASFVCSSGFEFHRSGNVSVRHDGRRVSGFRFFSVGFGDASFWNLFSRTLGD